MKSQKRKILIHCMKTINDIDHKIILMNSFIFNLVFILKVKNYLFLWLSILEYEDMQTTIKTDYYGQNHRTAHNDRNLQINDLSCGYYYQHPKQ